MTLKKEYIQRATTTARRCVPNISTGRFVSNFETKETEIEKDMGANYLQN